MIRTLTRRGRLVVVVLATSIAVAGCETGAQTGALAGGGIGALAGQAIGGNTEATLIGAAVGTGIGYIIGNEEDKKHARQMSASTASTSYTHNEVGQLGGTKWMVVSLAPRDFAPPYTSKLIEFRPDGRAICTTTNPDGTVTVDNERFRVVGSTLIVNKPGYLVNARFQISGDEMIVDAEDFRAVLKRLAA